MKEQCECEICKSGLEKRQYAHMELKDYKFIIDAREYYYLDQFFMHRSEIKDISEVDDNKNLIMVYGAIYPQVGADINKIKEDVEKKKNYGFGCIEDDKCYISSYEDIFILADEENQVHGSVPCACLLRTDLEFDDTMEFGHTLFLKYSNLDILTNVIQRDFIISVKRIEHKYNENIKEWKELIDRDKLIEIAKNIV